MSLKDNYDLALKLFASKDFSKAYTLTSRIADEAYRNFGTLDGALFVKIVSLYLVQVGTFLEEEIMSREDRNWHVSVLKSHEMVDRWTGLFGGLENVPSELLVNYHLVFRKHPSLLAEEKVRAKYLDEIGRLYTVITAKGAQDGYDGMLLQLYVFEILPAFGSFSLARSIVEANDAFSGNRSAFLERLDRIKQQKAEEEQQEKDKKSREEKRIREEKKRHEERKREELKERDLKYRSLREIRTSYDTEPKEKEREVIKARSVYLYGIAREYVTKNYPLLAVFVLLVVGGFGVMRKRKLRENLVETIRMAFKINYL